jgi:hypothetical protein
MSESTLQALVSDYLPEELAEQARALLRATKRHNYHDLATNDMITILRLKGWVVDDTPPLYEATDLNGDLRNYAKDELQEIAWGLAFDMLDGVIEQMIAGVTGFIESLGGYEITPTLELAELEDQALCYRELVEKALRYRELVEKARNNRGEMPITD